MLWSRWYSFKSYIRSALWVVPVIALLFEIIGSRLTEALGNRLVASGFIDQSKGLLDLGIPGARALLETIVTISISFLVFTFGSLLVAIQVASGQYTPRIIATTLLRDNAIRYSVGCFVFTLLFSLRTLNQMDTTVHQFQTLISGVLGALSVVVFLYLIDYAARMMRPVSIVHRIGQDGLAVIRSVYPLPTSGPPSPARHWSVLPCRTVHHRGSPGIVLAVDLEVLAARMQRMNGFVEFVPYVGDFIAEHEPLFRLYDEACSLVDHSLQGAVAFGTERTLEQDPTFALRILVDIALKALSPAINDPTTASLSIDQLHRMLFQAGSRHLQGSEITDKNGELRVVFRAPDWQDFVKLAFTEIRHCGAGSIQIARRLRAMGEDLIRALPEHRHAALLEELHLLDRTIEKHYVLPEDLALARVPDAQGLGSSRIAVSGFETK
ncbi:DUF2254 domain-containing protein [Geobacter sp. SVR]|uniref:DUF2254 domain-containing protein n=1 Tax=Geobacter sp. SVR TaxID=2495594 RepID=UPI00143F04F2|nr:DUF2254 domain-containing protein [Geobacter sp. SVR]BCS52892.1 hypothetical protein GSVR_12000 [Geobacter sp. SVR]GCF87514.1 hypothetical protein GSbR_41140 [Geobacter sp. SVR]